MDKKEKLLQKRVAGLFALLCVIFFQFFDSDHLFLKEEDIIYQIEHTTDYDLKKMREFRKKFMSSCDGHATERILKLVFGESW